MSTAVETQPFVLLGGVSNRVEWNALFVVHVVMDPVAQDHELARLDAPQGHDGPTPKLARAGRRGRG